MKIRKIKLKDHPILGCLEMDFTNPSTQQPFETIIFAGENGTGKTTILENLSTFLNCGSFEYFEYIEYIVDGTDYKAIPPSDNKQVKDFFDIVQNDNVIDRIRTNRTRHNKSIETTPLDIRHYGCVFSKARADYKTQQIRTTTTKNIDLDKYDIDDEDDFTSLKQLIVDIQNQDNDNYVELNKELGSTPKSWNEFYPTSKLYRFKNAFDNFFEKIKYGKVANASGEKSILFNKNGKEISIDKLSTGEKQVVFRGIYLLKNSKILNGAAIMIDEPELSMHPKWQKSVLKYYKDLFIDAGKQTVQLFIATHSEYVLEKALSDKGSNLVIVLNDLNGVIKSKKIDAPSVLPSITSAETNYLAFDIVSNDYHIELYGWLQQKESKHKIKLCDDYIKNYQFFNPSIHSKPSSHGQTNYDTLSTFIRNAIDHPDPSRTFTENELRISTELLIKLCSQ